MYLRLGGRRVCDVTAFERREPGGGVGPALMWFEVPIGTELDIAEVYELAGEDDVVAKLIQLLDHDPVRCLVIAIEADRMHVPN